jgi:hypothetical protein
MPIAGMPEGNVEAVSTTSADSGGKDALTVHRKILPGNIQLRSINRGRALIEERDLNRSGLPDRDRAKENCAG